MFVELARITPIKPIYFLHLIYIYLLLHKQFFLLLSMWAASKF